MYVFVRSTNENALVDPAPFHFLINFIFNTFLYFLKKCIIAFTQRVIHIFYLSSKKNKSKSVDTSYIKNISNILIRVHTLRQMNKSNLKHLKRLR